MGGKIINLIYTKLTRSSKKEENKYSINFSLRHFFFKEKMLDEIKTQISKINISVF